MNQVFTYPKAIPPKDYDNTDNYLESDFFSVRAAGQTVHLYRACVEMHHRSEASVGSVSFNGTLDFEITCRLPVGSVVVRPLSLRIHPTIENGVIRFSITEPCRISVEVNGDRFRNLHLFAERPVVRPDIEGVLYYGPGVHFLLEGMLRLESDTTVFLDGGAVLVGSLCCEGVKNVHICGPGVVWQGCYHRFSGFHSVRVSHSENICIEDVTFLNPPHYTICLGDSHNVTINRVKAFSCTGWSDGIDMMSCSDVLIQNCFLRNSDDCIAIYADRFDNYGDCHNVTVKGCTLWADVAHAVHIGTHGDSVGEGRVIENICIENIDILEHHEPQDWYTGALAINAGDQNIVRNVTFRNIRVEQMTHGALFKVRVACDAAYNPKPGRLVEHICFENIRCDVTPQVKSEIFGYSEAFPVRGVTLRNVTIGGMPLCEDNFITKFAENIQLERERR